MNKRQKKKWYKMHPVQCALTAAELEYAFSDMKNFCESLNRILDAVRSGNPGKRCYK